MANIYIDYATGNDSTGTGASGAPYKTLQKAINVGNGGDTIHVANTSAQVIAAGGIVWTGGWAASQGADSGHPLVIKPWDNGGAQVIAHPVLGNITAFAVDASSIAGGAKLFNASWIDNYVRIEGMKVTGMVGSFATADEWSLFRCQVDASTLGSGEKAISFANASGGCRAVDCYISGGVNAGGIGIHSIAHSTILGCFIDGVEATAVGISCAGTDDAVLHNIVTGVAGTGINVTNGNNIIGNTVRGDGSTASAIGINCAANSTPAVLNNVVANFSGASNVGIKAAATIYLPMLGYNGFYSNAANYSGTFNPAVDLTAYDKAFSVDPFDDAAGDDFTMKAVTSDQPGLPLFLGSATAERYNIGAVAGNQGADASFIFFNN